jgi:hypothetical protein
MPGTLMQRPNDREDDNGCNYNGHGNGQSLSTAATWRGGDGEEGKNGRCRQEATAAADKTAEAVMN